VVRATGSAVVSGTSCETGSSAFNAAEDHGGGLLHGFKAFHQQGSVAVI
jgi:hypothetical protein